MLGYLSKDTQKDKHSKFFLYCGFSKRQGKNNPMFLECCVFKEETGGLGQRLPGLEVPGPLPQSQLQRGSGGAGGFCASQELSLAWETLNLWECPGHQPEGGLWLELAWFADPHTVPWEGSMGRHSGQSQG